MMRVIILSFILCLVTVGLVSAQEEEQSPYEIALQRIEDARVSGATSLDLSRLGLEELPPEIGNLDNLQSLHLGNNLLSSLPPEIGNLDNLQSLYLGNNLLSSLPPEIGNLDNLQSLYLNVNLLSSLPSEIGNLGNMDGLDLSNNLLSSLPPEIGNLDKLLLLWINNNQLVSLPLEIGKLENLCRLDLKNNLLQTLPYTLGEFDKLSQENMVCRDDYGAGLYIDGNPFISPPPEVIEQGTAAILDYLRNEAWWHLQRLIAGGASSVGLVAALVLGLRWRQRRKYGKKKREV